MALAPSGSKQDLERMREMTRLAFSAMRSPPRTRRMNLARVRRFGEGLGMGLTMKQIEQMRLIPMWLGLDLKTQEGRAEWRKIRKELKEMPKEQRREVYRTLLSDPAGGGLDPTKFEDLPGIAREKLAEQLEGDPYSARRIPVHLDDRWAGESTYRPERYDPELGPVPPGAPPSTEVHPKRQPVQPMLPSFERYADDYSVPQGRNIHRGRPWAMDPERVPKGGLAGVESVPITEKALGETRSIGHSGTGITSRTDEYGVESPGKARDLTEGRETLKRYRRSQNPARAATNARQFDMPLWMREHPPSEVELKRQVAPRGGDPRQTVFPFMFEAPQGGDIWEQKREKGLVRPVLADSAEGSGQLGIPFREPPRGAALAAGVAASAVPDPGNIELPRKGKPSVARPSVPAAPRQAPATPKQGGNVWSGGAGILAALTNPTELARRKGNLTEKYPVVFRGREFPDAETAYKTHQVGRGPSPENRQLMREIIEAKLEQHPRLRAEIDKRGGAAWLASLSHKVGRGGGPWEGEGTKSPFIQVLTEAYEGGRSARRPTPATPAHLVGLSTAEKLYEVYPSGPVVPTGFDFPKKKAAKATTKETKKMIVQDLLAISQLGPAERATTAKRLERQKKDTLLEQRARMQQMWNSPGEAARLGVPLVAGEPGHGAGGGIVATDSPGEAVRRTFRRPTRAPRGIPLVTPPSQKALPPTESGGGPLALRPKEAVKEAAKGKWGKFVLPALLGAGLIYALTRGGDDDERAAEPSPYGLPPGFGPHNGMGARQLDPELLRLIALRSGGGGAGVFYGRGGGTPYPTFQGPGSAYQFGGP